LAPLFAVTLFLSAALLFLVQPLVGKLLLPLAGGTPAVWNTCLVFFQALLLLGYLYAHRSTSRLGARRQAGWHLPVLLAPPLAFALGLAWFASPLPVLAWLLPADQDYPVFGLLALLAIAVGVPFLVLSTTAPLLQSWFARSGRPAGRDPYFLYAASNAGSLLGLLGYPFLVEPNLPLANQQRLWAIGVVVCLALVAICAVVSRRGGTEVVGWRGIVLPAAPLERARVLRWVVLAALPSGLLVSVTAHLTTDVAPVPLLWVVPLALYLWSFIVVFAWWPARLHRLLGRVTPMLLVFLTVALVTGATEPLAPVATLHLLAFLAVALLCHGELAGDRPPAGQLTAFYLWLSAGGVLGGLLCALVAPLVFARLGLVEYPLALLLAALVRPAADRPPGGWRWSDLLAPVALGLVTAALMLLVPRWLGPAPAQESPDYLPDRLLRVGLMVGAPAAVSFALVRRPMRFALCLGALFLAGTLDREQRGLVLLTRRNFFGTLQVNRTLDGTFVRLVHGNTRHGQQRLDEDGPPRPMMYYHERGPVGRLLRSLPEKRLKRVGVVGLGVGAMAAYARPGQEWTFYEIDPAVVRIARDSDHFTFLEHCRGECAIVLGDARRELARESEGTFDLLAIDAFSSDAIPVHLLTREALALYVALLRPNGLLVMHLSNRYLDLPPLVGRLAADHDPPLVARKDEDWATDEEREDGKYASTWVVLARREADLGKLAKDPRWQRIRPARAGWTDDFSNLLSVWKGDEP
jgi:hypothetical protein